MAYEEPAYEVIESEGSYELRRYAPSVTAEVVLEGEPDKVDNEAFFILAGYIGGKNVKKTSIPMTAPVSEERVSEKIPMTAPVSQENVDGKWRVTFHMPGSYTLETLPEPLDGRIRLAREEGKLTAALRFSGTWSRDNYERKKEELYEIIDARGLRPVGEPVFARYNSPFTLWFLRRNEVLIPVVQG